MAFGLVVYDLLYLTLATALYWTAAAAGLKCYQRASTILPVPVAAAVGVVGALLALILAVGVLCALCPRLKKGRYPMMRGKVFFGWLFRSLLRRILFFPGLKWVLFSSNVLRYLSLRALGARVAFTANISADVDILDPSLLTVGPGAVLGARTFISGHYVVGKSLRLDEVRIGANALLALSVVVAPGAVIGEGAVMKPGSAVSVGGIIGAKADIGTCALIDIKGRVADGAVIEPRGYVPTTRRSAS